MFGFALFYFSYFVRLRPCLRVFFSLNFKKYKRLTAENAEKSIEEVKHHNMWQKTRSKNSVNPCLKNKLAKTAAI